MIILIAGASHAGKTVLAQKLLNKYRYSCLSIDLLKMGLIRSGNTKLTPEDDGELVGYLWPIVREIIKTAIENRQNLIIEGIYIPFDWKKDFEDMYLHEMKYVCLVMTKKYIEEHFDDIKSFANVIEKRFDDSSCTKISLIKDNTYNFEMCKKFECNYILIDDVYQVEFEI
ncbi:MAG: ATP-binding protein [Alistipes sp.]|nr:ATP-binding protein [Alistipes sp.]